MEQEEWIRVPEEKKMKGSLITELNKLTIKNKHLLPRINDLFNQLQGVRIFFKIV